MKLAEVSFPKIGPRLVLSFVVLIALILGGNALLLWQFHIASLQMGRLNGANQQVIAVLRLQGSLLSLHQRLDTLERTNKAYSLATDADLLRETLLEQIKRIRSDLAHLPSETRVDPALMPTLDAIEATSQSQLQAIAELSRSNDSVAMRLRLASELTPLEAHTSALVKSTDEEVSAELAQTVESMRMVQRRILVLVPTMAISTSLIAGFFGWATARRMMALRLEERVGERARIARDLHDTLLQSFQGVLLKFHALTYLLKDRPEVREELETVIEQANQAIIEARDAVQGLRSSTVVTNDLANEIGTLAKELESNVTGPNVPAFRLEVAGTPHNLHPILRDEVYRIGGECLRNAFQHAEARHIDVEIQYDENRFRMRVRDDGRGIDPTVLAGNGREGHYGMSGVRERAKLIGGKLHVMSELHRGTEVELTVPGGIAYVASPRRRRWSFRKGSFS